MLEGLRAHSRGWNEQNRDGAQTDERIVTDIVVNGVFYARLPKWDEMVAGRSANMGAPAARRSHVSGPTGAPERCPQTRG